MTVDSQSESSANRIARLEAELAAERVRAETAEDQLRRVHEGIRAYKQKQEQFANARKAREARARAIEAETSPEPVEPSMQQIGQDSGVAEAWGDPDPTLDERLTKYLESTFEPDRSRDWMLQG